MASEIKLPPLGENLSQGQVLDIKVQQGDAVSVGQALVEIEAEKSTVEVPATVAGKLTQVLVKKGDTVKSGQTLFVIDGEGNGAVSAAPAPAAEKPAAEKPAAEKPAAEKPADKAEPPQAHEEPTPTTFAPPAAPTARGTDSAPSAPATAAFNAEPHPGPMTGTPTKADGDQPLVPAGPATRQLARELGVDLTKVKGTAPGGRVTREDVKAYVRDIASQPAAAPGGSAGGVVVPPMPEFEKWGPVDRQPLEGVRRKTAEQMNLAWSQIPHVTQHDLTDITELDAFRRQQSEKGPKLTVTAFALKAAAAALKKFPQFNSSIDLAKNQLVFKKYIHIGVAVDTERGLLVPVIRDVDRKSIEQLAVELNEIAEKARAKKITADEMRGGTFTITNLGGVGGVGFTPIVNYPEVAILGMSRASTQPVWKDDKFVPRLMLPLSLSYDHRVIDGANAARFTRFIADLLQNLLMMVVQA